MSTIAFIDLARIIREAGWPGGVPHATAVALVTAESGRNPDAVNTNEGGSAPGSRDRGLWQINDHYHDLSDEDAFDPVKSTEYALKLYRENGFEPWAAYKNGAYQKHMEAARVALDGWSREKAARQEANVFLNRLTDAVGDRDALQSQVDAVTAYIAEAMDRLEDALTV